MKKLLSLLCVLALFTASLAWTAAAEGENEFNKCGENLTWEENGDTLIISGTGAMNDYFLGTGNPPWRWSASAFKKIIVGEGVTHIGVRAFYFCNQVTEISLPKSLVSIGSSAFQFCTSLGDLVIPPNVTSIDDNAFQIIPDGMVYQEEINLQLIVTDGSYAHQYAQSKDLPFAVKQPDAPVRIPGDVNGDGKVNGMDVLRLARFLAGHDVTINESAADVNASGAVDGRDLLRLSRYLAGQDVELK